MAGGGFLRGFFILNGIIRVKNTAGAGGSGGGGDF